MRKSFRSFVLKFGLAMLVLSLNLFSACDMEIGLGASVDVDVPVITITEPKTSAIIRDAFTITGTWADDGTITDIDVYLKNSETDQTFTFKGVINEDKTWNCLIDPTKAGATIRDGKYEVTVKIKDAVEHKSETSRSYVIDNTAPVVVLSRPASVKDETDTNKIESYGQYLTIEGQAADDNDIDRIVIKFYDKDDPTKAPVIKEITSVPPTISLDVAKFLDHDVYSAIYGEDKDAGEKAYYCEIIAYDGAKRYPVAGQEKEDDNYGNSEPSYILWSDWEKFQTAYQKATGSTSKIKLPDLYELKAEQNTSTASRSATENSLITNLFAGAISAGSFKLNPLNNPTYSISGLSLGIAGDVENDRVLTVQLSKGLDGISLDTDNMKVYLIPVTTDAQGKEVLGEKIYPQQSEFQQKGDGQFLTTIQKENCKNAAGNIVALEYGKTYIIGVDGKDTENNPLVPSFDGTVFYIRFKAKNVAPTLTLTSPTASNTYLMKGKTLVISGTTSVPDGYPTVSITCKKGEETTGTTVYERKVTDADFVSNEGGLITYSFEYEIPTSGSGFYFDQSQSNQYVFDITSDLDKMPTTRTKTVIYDVDGPTISLDSMLPTAKKYDLDAEDGSGEDGYLNGDVTMKVSILDDYDTVQTALEEGKDRRPYFIIVDEAGNELPFMVGTETRATVKHYITTPAKQSFIIHTKDIADGSDEKKIKVKIFAEDRAGNKGVDIEDITKTSFEREFKVDQTTDAPVILPKNAKTNTVKMSDTQVVKTSNRKNIYSGNQTVSYRLIDDDGLSSVTYKISGTNYNPEAVTIALNDVTEYILDLIMPEDPNVYNVDITVSDNKNNPAVNKNFYVRVTAAAPVIKSIKFDKAPVGKTDDIIAKVSIKSDQKPFTLERTVKNSAGVEINNTTLTQADIPELDTENPVIEDSFSAASVSTSGDYKVYYKVQDVNYKIGTGDESITVDLNEPVISDVKLESAIHENTKWYNSKNLALSLTAEDKLAGDTGVSQVKYSLDGGQNWIPLAKSGSIYSGTVIFQNDSANNTLKILAEDAAGNATEQTATVKIDTITPVVTYTATNLKNAASEAVTSITSGDYYCGEDAVTITGIVSDTNYTNNASYVTVEATNSATNITPAFVAGNKFTITPALQDGETKITIKVKDFAGNTKENIISIHRDTKGPGIEIKLPQEDSTNPLDDDNYTFRINANDGNDGVGVAKIYYKFTNDNSTPTDWGTGEAFSGGDFYIARDFIEGHVEADGKLTEGNWYLHVKAEDKSGNVTTTDKTATDTKLHPRHFVVDKKDPSIDYVKYEGSVLTEKTDFYYDATTFTLTGSVSDTNGIKQVKVGDDIVEVTNKIWSKAITITANQRNEIIVEVEDVAGRKTSKTYYVYKDTAAPVINLNAPAESVGTLTDEKYKFVGSVSDAGSGISAAKYLFTQTSFADEAAIKASASTGTGWTSIENGELSVEKNLGGTAAANLKEGKWYLYIYAKDNVSGSDANHVKVFSKEFWVDRALPDLAETKVGTPGAQVKLGGKLTLSGTASDNNGIENIIIKDGTGDAAKTWTIAGTAITNDSWSIDINPGSDTQTEKKLADGTHTLTITATDKAGRSSSLERTVVVDTAAPTHGTLSVTSTGNTVGTGDAAKTWYNSSFINIKIVDVADPANGSGVSTVEYTIDNGAHWNPMSGSEGTYTATVNCTSQGSNTIKVQIKDVVGNVKDAGGKTVYVDTVLPTLTTSKVKYRTTDFESSSEILVNGDYGYDLQIEVADTETSGTDMNSGIAAVKYAYGNHTIAAKQSGNYWTVNVPATNGVDKYDSDKTNPIYALITDKAGNEAKERILTVTKDSDPPSVSFKSVTTPGSKTKVSGVDVEDVNGKITITGSASDTNKLSTVVLQYQKAGAGETAWNDLAQTSESTANNWIAELDTTALSNNTKYTIKAIATDAAGNTKEAVKDIYVNQDTDRPVITLTNIDLTETIFGNNEIYGNVSDDDGVPSTISYYIGDEKPTASTTWTTPAANSDFTYTNGSFKLKLSDGPQIIWFKVNDGTKDYISSDLTSYSTDAQKAEILSSVKIIDSKNHQFGYLPETGTTITASAVSTTIDTTAPFITNIGWTYATTTPDWQSISSKPTTGGTGDKKEINIRVYAYDINTVDTIKLKVPKNSSDKSTVSGYSTAAGDVNNDYYIYNFKEAASTDTDATKEVDGHTYNKWTSAKIIATGMESGLRECKLEVFDGAKTTTETVNITIDNTPAEFEFTTHKDNQTVYGIKDIEVGGTVTAADMKHVYYYLTKDDVATADAAKTRIGTNWKEILFEANKLSAVIKFDGDTAATDTTGVTHEERLKIWLKDLYEVSDIDNYNDTKVLKLWVYVVDEIENSSEPKALSLKVIPNGDKPVVKITYPDDNAKLGGTIRFSGETTIETNSVEKVYAQILVPASIDASNDDWVTKLDKLISDAKNKSTGSEPYYKVVNITSTLKGIEVSGTPTSWNFAINSHHELEKEGETPDYTINIIAKSASGKISDTVSRTVQIDKNAPSLSDMQLVKLKNENAANKFAESNIDKRITYKEDMWISGQWYLIGSVTDGNGVKQLLWHDGTTSHTLVEGNNTTNTGTIKDDEKVVKSTEHTTHYTEPTVHDVTAYDYDFRIPIGEDSDYGTITYKISAVDATAESNSVERTITVNYDCASPNFKATVSADDNAVELSGTGNKVQNSSGMYSVYGTFDEEGKQSGFERIAMYFTRTIGNTTNVLDPLVTKDRSSGTNDKHNNYYPTGFQYTSVASHGDGIYWKELTATKTESDTITVSVSDDWIRKGGICKVDGVIYKIKTVTTSAITVDGTLPSGTSKKVYVTPALVIDNLSPESKKQGATYNGLYQKNVEDTTVISGGDGDWLIEGVTKQTNSYPWSASLNSQNMLDGPVTIHFVAFDKAGNATEKSYSGNVANNAPRLAGVTVWTDYNGNGKGWRNTGDHAADYEDETKSRYYSRVRPTINGKATDRSNDVTSKLIVSGNADDVDGIAADSSTAFMKVTDTVKFIPEIVGGNGALFYEYKIGKKAAFTVDSTTTGSKALKSTAKAAITKDDGTTAVSGTDDGQTIPIATDTNSVTYVTGNTESVITFDGKTILGALDNSTSDAPTWFDVVISDSTEGDTKLSCEMQIALQNNYTDVQAPEVKIRPFYWNSKTENSVSWTKDSDNKLIAEGHIELEDDLPTSYKPDGTGVNDRDPKVSGKIKIEGYAFDDIKLKELYVNMSGHSNLADRTAPVASYSNGSWTIATHAADAGWDFTAADVYCNAAGHLVKWTLTVDTAKRLTPAQTNQTVVVYADDARGSATTKTSEHDGETQTSLTTYRWGDVKSQENAYSTYFKDFWCNRKVDDETADSAIVYKEANKASMTYYYKMDIVPYVTKVETGLSKNKSSNWSVYNRTALGHYPVQSVVTNAGTGINLKTTTSENVTLYGFNLNHTSAKFTSGSSNFATNATGNLKITNSIDTTTALDKLTFNVANLQSGVLNLTVNDVPVMNNNNKNEALGTASEAGESNANYYNLQPNGDTSNIQSDDVEFDVWEFNDRAAVPINGLATGINMEVNQKTGMLNYAFANGGLYYSMGGNTDKTNNYSAANSYSSYYWAADWDTFAGPCVGFHVDELGYTYSVVSGGDTNSGGSVDKWDLYTSRWGYGLHDTGGTLNEGNSAEFHALRLEEVGLKTGNDGLAYSLMKYRFLSPEFASTVNTTNNSTNLYLVYYDALTNQIRFRAGTFTGTTTDPTGGFVDQYTGGNASYYNTNNCQVIANGKGGATFTTGIGPGARIQTTNVAEISGRGAGQYVDVAVVKNTAGKDVVCVVWFDADANCCKFSYITDPISNWNTTLKGNATAASWSPIQTIFAEGGEYCHIVADKNNHLHIAAYAGNGDVMYAYLDSYSSTASTCIVDASGAVGEHLTLDVAVVGTGANAHSIPYIGYFTSAIKMPKYAYLVNKTTGFSQTAAGVDLDERFTGAWEVTVIPTPSRMTTNREDKVNIGVWKNAGVLTNSTTGTSTRGGTLNGYDSTNWSKTFGNSTSNAVLGYQIATSTGSCLETAQMR